MGSNNCTTYRIPQLSWKQAVPNCWIPLNSCRYHVKDLCWVGLKFTGKSESLDCSFSQQSSWLAQSCGKGTTCGGGWDSSGFKLQGSSNASKEGNKEGSALRPSPEPLFGFYIFCTSSFFYDSGEIWSVPAVLISSLFFFHCPYFQSATRKGCGTLTIFSLNLSPHPINIHGNTHFL